MSFSAFKRLNYLLPLFVDVEVAFVLATALVSADLLTQQKNVLAVTYLSSKLIRSNHGILMTYL